jgi:hypothetical protein
MYKAYVQRLGLQELYQTVLFKNQVYPLYQKYVYKSDRIVTYVTYAAPYVFPDPAPDIVNMVIPVSVYGLYIGEFLNFRFLTHTSYLSTKPLTRFSISWEYRKPALFVGYQGQVEVRVSWKLYYDEEKKEAEVDPETRDILVDLTAGYLLAALGRSRRMVRIGDSNMEFDAEALVGEGEELVKEARERLLQFADLTALNF